MATTSNSIYTKFFEPVYQTLLVFGISIFIMLVAKIVAWLGWVEISGEFFWSISATFILFFAILNSLISISTKDLNQYWTRSMACFAALVLSSGFVAYLLSWIPIEEASTYKWIYVVLTFGYLVFLSLIGFMKRIVEFAEQEDWQSPKKKKK